jgi:hypothetical protein
MQDISSKCFPLTTILVSKRYISEEQKIATILFPPTIKWFIPLMRALKRFQVYKGKENIIDSVHITGKDPLISAIKSLSGEVGVISYPARSNLQKRAAVDFEPRFAPHPHLNYFIVNAPHTIFKKKQPVLFKFDDPQKFKVIAVMFRDASNYETYRYLIKTKKWKKIGGDEAEYDTDNVQNLQLEGKRPFLYFIERDLLTI